MEYIERSRNPTQELPQEKRNSLDFLRIVKKEVYGLKRIPKIRREESDFRKHLLLILAVLFITALVFFSVKDNLNLTGRSVFTQETETHQDNLNLEISSPQIYEWIPENSGQLLSSRVSGKLILNEGGYVRVYLGDRLIFDSSKSELKDNSKSSSNSLIPITGHVVEEVGESIIETENQLNNLPENLTISLPLTENLTENFSEEILENLPENLSENLTENIPENIAENVSENITEEIPENQTSENESTPSTPPEPSVQVQEFSFSDICIETCNLEDFNLTDESYNIRFEIENASINIENIGYEILPVKIEENITENISQENITENISQENITLANFTENITQQQAIVGQPVKWSKRVSIPDSDKAKEIKIDVPLEAENIQVNEIEKVQGQGVRGGEKEARPAIQIDEKKIELDTGKVKIEEKDKGIEISINATAQEYEITYETPAPEISEREISKNRKEITVIGPDSVHYQNVLASINFQETPKEKIKLYWLINGTRQLVENITYFDENNNGLIERIEWIVPSLSEQRYEIVIEITKAEHLDENYTFVSDIYQEVYHLDDIWSEEIPSEHYVRVTFEKNLTNENDITLYPRIVSGSPRIEVYEKEGTKLIAEFTNIQDRKYNKVLLTNLEGEQDTFDLKILDGSLEFDHIIDPALSGVGGTYFDDFESAIDTNWWTTMEWARQTAGLKIGAPIGTYYLASLSTVGTFRAILSADTTDVTSLTLSYYTWVYIKQATVLTVDWYNGTGWTTLATYNTNGNQQFRTHSLPSSANNNPNLQIRFTCTGAHAQDECAIDNFNLSGTYAAPVKPVAVFGTNPINYYNSTSSSVTFDMKCYDAVSVSMIRLWTNSTGTWHANYTNSSYTNNTWLNITVPGIPNGNNFKWAVWCNNSVPLTNITINRTFNLDSIPPVVRLPVYINATKYQNTQTFVYNISVTDSGSGSGYCSIGVGTNSNITVPVSGGWCNGTNYALTGLSDGNKTIYAYANDTLGNTALNDSFAVQIDSTPPVFNTIPANASLFYGNQSLSVNFVATDNIEFGYYSINDTRFLVSQAGALSNATPIAVGNYTINVTINDSSNNKNWTFYRVQVNKSEYYNCGVFFNTTSPITYPATFTANTNCSSAYTLYRNATSIANGSEVRSGAGYYNITVRRTDTQNYSNVFNQQFFTVDKNEENCEVKYNATSPIDFPDTFLVWQNCTTTTTLKRNGTTISNNSEQILPASAYNFSLLRTDTQNYSIFYNESEFIVNKVTPTLTKKLNGADSDFIGIYPIQVNASGYTNYGTLSMYRNATDIISQNNVNLSILAGYHDFIFSVTGNENISDVADQHLYATINKNDTSCDVYFNATNPIDYPDKFIAYTNCSSAYSFYINGTSISNASTIDSGAGYYNLSVQRTDTENYTEIFNQQFFTVSKSSDPCNTLFNETSPITYPNQYTAYSDCGSTFTLNKNGTEISNNSVQNSGAGYWNFSTQRTDTQNYTNTYSDEFFTVDKATTQGSLASTKGWTYDYDAASTTISYSESNNGDTDVDYRVWRNDSYESSGETVNLPAGAYLYKLNSTEGANYTLNDSITTEMLTINRNNEVCNVTFNETSPLTYPLTFSVWSNCTSSFTLYRNGTTISNNSEQIMPASAYNFSFLRADSVNYSNYYDEEEFQITPSNSICDVYFNATSPINYPDKFIVYTNCSSAYTLKRNDTAISNNSVVDSGAGYYNLSVQRTDLENYSSTYSDEFFTVDKSEENCWVQFNVTSPINYPETFLVWQNCTTTTTLYRNGTGVDNNSEQALAVSAYNFSLLRTDTQNYSIYYNETEMIVLPTLDTEDPVAVQGTNPINNYNDTDGSITFDMKCYDNIAVSTIQLWTNSTGTWHANYSNLSYTNNTWLNITVPGIPENVNYKWAVWCNDTAALENITENRTFSVDKTDPVAVFGTNPVDNYNDTDGSITFDFKCYDNVAVSTIQLWSNSTGTWHANYTNDSMGDFNDTWLNITVDGIPDNQNYKWMVYCNDTVGLTNYTENRALNVETGPSVSFCRNLTTADTIYTLIQNVSSEGTCFNVTAENVTIDCNGFTINYSSSSVGYGVYTNQFNTTVKNCIILQTASIASSPGIYLYGSNNGTISGNNITTLASMSSGINVSSSYNNFYNNKISAIITNGVQFNLGSDYNLFLNNIVTTFLGNDVIDVYSKYNNISNNLFNAQFGGVYIITGHNNSFSNNNHSGGLGVGVISGSSNNTFSNINVVTSTSNTWGVRLYSGANNNNFSNINIQITGPGAGNYGVYSLDSTGNLFMDSIINASDAGVPDIYIRGNGINNFTNVTFNKSDTTFYAGATGLINVFWYADAYVNYSNGTAVDSANVSITDVNSILQNWSLTNSSGYTPRLTLREYMQNATSMYFDTNYTFNGTLDGYGANWTEINLTDNAIDEDLGKVVLTLSAADNPPVVETITSIPGQSITEQGETNVTFFANITDPDGISNIDVVNATFNMTGQAIRSNATCVNVTSYNSTKGNYSCTVRIWYWDQGGDWNVTVNVNDSEGNEDSKADTFVLGSTSAFVISPNSLSWGTISPSSTNNLPSDSVLMNNTGNTNITAGGVQVRAYDLIGFPDDSYSIQAGNFSAAQFTGGSSECNETATTMVNVSYEAIPGHELNIGNNTAGLGQANLYYCLRQVPSGIISQDYNTTGLGSWTIKIVVLAVMILPARRKKKKKKQKEVSEELSELTDLPQDKLDLLETMMKIEKLKELRQAQEISTEDILKAIKAKKEGVPISLFDSGLAPSEALIKYLKDNLKLNYHKIAELLNRDDRTVWATYQNASKKIKGEIEISSKGISIPVSIFANRKLSILESLVNYLINKGRSYKEISELIGKDQRNIWTINSRAGKKLGNKN